MKLGEDWRGEDEEEIQNVTLMQMPVKSGRARSKIESGNAEKCVGGHKICQKKKSQRGPPLIPFFRVLDLLDQCFIRWRVLFIL